MRALGGAAAAGAAGAAPVAVAYFSPNGAVNGSLLDALDAAVFLHRNGVPAELVIVGMQARVVEQIVAERYADFSGLGDARFCRFRFSVPRTHYRRIVSSYGSYRRLGPWMRTQQWFVLPSQRLHMDAARGRIRSDLRTVFLLDPLQHAYPVRRKRAYVKKILPIGAAGAAGAAGGGEPESALLVNTVSPHKRASLDELGAWVAGNDVPRRVRILAARDPGRLPEGWEWLRPPVPRLFGLFSDYLYVYPKGGYDENPRMLIESLALGRRIHVWRERAIDPPCERKIERIFACPQDFIYAPNDALLRWMQGGAP